MSEKLHTKHEKHSAEHTNIEKEVQENLKRIKEAEHSPSELAEAHTEALRSRVESEAVSGKEMSPAAPEEATQTHSFAAHAELKLEAYRKLLKSTQEQLPQVQRRFSQFVHKASIESISEVASKTIARPVGIALGSLITFVGVSITLLMAYRYGFTYNYLLFVLLFIGGYIAATALEISYKYLIKRAK